MSGQSVSQNVREPGLQNEEYVMQMNNHWAPSAEALLSSPPTVVACSQPESISSVPVMPLL